VTSDLVASPLQAGDGIDARRSDVNVTARIVALALGVLLVGYMFLGRGFAHIGVGPVYIGDAVMLLGVAGSAYVAIRARLRPPVTWTVALLVAFVALGAVRTLPYLSTHEMDALRDGVLWGYAAFAFIVYVLADRRWLLDVLRAYGWVVPVFALWLPISWRLAVMYSATMDPTAPGSDVPLAFFKGGDMAVHTIGSIAFLVLGARAAWSVRTFVWRTVIVLPFLFTIFVAGTANRGALLTALAGIAAVVLVAHRSRNWLPILAATAVFVIAGVVQSVVAAGGGWAAVEGATATPLPSQSGTLTDTSQSTERNADGGLALQNDGFETPADSTGTVAGWTPRGAEVTVVEGGAYRGDRFASLRNSLGAYEATLKSARFAFEDGVDIAVSAWGKSIAGRPILEIYVNWYNRSGSMISSDFVTALSTDGLRSWREADGSRAAPEDATHAEILFYEATGGATIGIDHVAAIAGDFAPEIVPAAPGEGRPATLQQMVENIFSVFGSSSDPGLEGTKQFRLAWWGTIIDYAVFGDYFWTGKGFGVNLADDDGFQSTADGSLRAPHNSHFTVLARMGVPGFVLWLALQLAFGVGLMRATLALRRAGDKRLAAVGAWVLVYWLVIMVDTSFDPYLEGPQGGIWFWTVFGLGLVVMRQIPRRRRAA